ncbi:SGNH/GDSL hydrolase family protein [Dyella sp. BiH032]|uniref:SGNH/GDSL hydrolase family protein n=1 Tax=Dyella sp. BiH032 TaxID=3075430 RepID=UPI0028934384|nr:SGNH/GDSL hydrolase family protein [Dyella sp. BiH032]WNL44165.1 SGNH/GDSL hydrolase family protein [Dyella sp. BiH032]
MPRQLLKLVLLGSLCALFAPAWSHPPTASASHWVAAWGAAVDSPGPHLSDQTVRQVVRISAGGSAVRIRLSNLFGAGPVTIGPARIALRAQGSSTVAGSDHAVSFGGKRTVTVPKGESVLSDPMAMDVKPLQELTVSLYIPATATPGPSTLHNAGLATTYLTETGDATAATSFPGTEVHGSRFFLSDVEVAGPDERHAVVAFGDSITDGVGARSDTYERWPDHFAERLRADPGLAKVAVVNSGIGGNRVLNDGFGPSAQARFDRDALDKPGVRWIVLLEGINDIGGSGQPGTPADNVSAEQIIEGMKQLIARAHAKGVKIYGATLTPFGGAGWPYHSSRNEKKREAVNAWIRDGGAFDGVADFDKAIRDPAHPDRMLPTYDSGDHLHPNGAGFDAMAKAVDLDWFRR